MRIEVTTRVIVTDSLGKHIATAELTERKDFGDNPSFFVSESFPVAEDLAERAVLTAARGIDRSRASKGGAS